MRKYFFAKLLSHESNEVGDLCFSDRDIGKIFVVYSRFNDNRFRCPDYPGSIGISGVNWGLLHD